MKQYKNKATGEIAIFDEEKGLYKILNSPCFILSNVVENTCDWEPYNTSSVYEILSYTNCDEIQSVKRLEDGAIFEVGGYASPSYCDVMFGKIEKMNIAGDTIQIWGHFNKMYGMGFLNQLNPFIPKDYEVLEMVNPLTQSVITFKKGSCIGISSLPDADLLAIIEAISACDTTKFEITKIKRLSDGQVISVGEEFGYEGCGNEIIKFKISKIEFETAPADKGTGKISFIHDTKYLGKWLNIEQIAKPKPLFETKDGVEIFEGGHYFAIEAYVKGFTVVPYEAGKKPHGIAQYSTFEKAKASLPYYQRRISIYDIEQAIGPLGVSETYELLNIVSKNSKNI